MKKRMRRLLGILTAVIFAIQGTSIQAVAEGGSMNQQYELLNSGFGTTYYVDSAAGDDQNAGTSQSEAWKSLDKVNSVVFQPGDHILFKAGGYWIGQLMPQGSGNARDGAIVIDQYGDGPLPLIDANGATENSAAVIRLYNQEYIEISNLELKSSSDIMARRCGILVIGRDAGTLNHIYIRDCYIHDVLCNASKSIGLRSQANGGDADESGSEGAIAFKALRGGDRIRTNFNDVLIDGNRIERTGVTGGGIVLTSEWKSWEADGFHEEEWAPFFGSTNVLVSNNDLKNTAVAVYLEGMDGRTGNGVVVENNVSYKPDNIDSNAGMWLAHCYNVVWQYNEIYALDNGGSNDCGAFDADGNTDGTIFQYNYTHENRGEAVMFCNVNWDSNYQPHNATNNIFRYNISVNDMWGARDVHGRLWVQKGAQNSWFYNNVIYVGEGLPGRNISVEESDNNYFYNNIFINKSADSTYYMHENASVFSENNCFYGCHPEGEPSSDPSNIVLSFEDPLPVVSADIDPANVPLGRENLAGFQLPSGSVCIGKGKLLENNGGKDFWGNIVSSTQAPDIGAYQSSSGKDETAPSAPEGVTAEAAGCDAVNISWEAAADNVEIDHYVVYVNGCPVERTRETSWMAADLREDTSYLFKVRAFDATGNYRDSAEVRETTKPAADAERTIKLTASGFYDGSGNPAESFDMNQLVLTRFTVTDGNGRPVANARVEALTDAENQNEYQRLASYTDENGVAELGFTTGCYAGENVPVKVSVTGVYKDGRSYDEAGSEACSQLEVPVKGIAVDKLGNLVENFGFESYDADTFRPDGWSIAASGGIDAARVVPGIGPDGSAALEISAQEAYNGLVLQNINNVPNGNYVLTLYVKNTVPGASIAITDNGNDSNTVLPTSGRWQQIAIPDITVTTGHISLQFNVPGRPGLFTVLDNVELAKNLMKNSDLKKVMPGTNLPSNFYYRTENGTITADAAEASKLQNDVSLQALKIRTGYTTNYLNALEVRGGEKCNVTVGQTLKNLPDGTYSFSVRTVNTGGMKGTITVKDCGGEEKSQEIEFSSGVVTTKIGQIEVTDGTATIEMSFAGEGSPDDYILVMSPDFSQRSDYPLEAKNLVFAGDNLLANRNPSFEEDGEETAAAPSGWNVTWAQGISTATTSPEDAHTGDFSAKISLEAKSSLAFTTVGGGSFAGLPTGYYTFGAWIKGTLDVKLSCTPDGTYEREANSVTDEEWHYVSITDIPVVNGEMVLSFWCDNVSDHFVYALIDDAELYLQEEHLDNKSFESLSAGWKVGETTGFSEMQPTENSRTGGQALRIVLPGTPSTFDLLSTSNLNSLQPGSYVFSVYIKGTSAVELHAQADMEEEVVSEKVLAGDEWQQIVLKAAVHDSIRELGIRVSNPADVTSSYLTIDDFSLVREITTEDVAGLIGGLNAVPTGSKTIELPQVREGFGIELAESSHPDIISLDGSVVTPANDTRVTLTFKITNNADPLQSSFITETVQVFGSNGAQGSDFGNQGNGARTGKTSHVVLWVMLVLTALAQLLMMTLLLLTSKKPHILAGIVLALLCSVATAGFSSERVYAASGDFPDNPGFETGMRGWSQDGEGTISISGDAYVGQNALQISLEAGESVTIGKDALSARDLRAGYYMLAFRVKGDCDVTAQVANISQSFTSGQEYQTFVVKDIPVTDESLKKFEFVFTADVQTVILFDEVEFYRQIGPGGLIDSMTVTIADGRLVLPEAPEGYQITLRSSDREGLMDPDGIVAEEGLDAPLNVVLDIRNRNDATDWAKTELIAVTKYTRPGNGMILNAGFEEAEEPGFTDHFVGHGQINEMFTDWYGFGWWGEDGNDAAAIHISHTTDAHGGNYAARIHVPKGGWPMLNLFQQNEILNKIKGGTWRFSFWTKGTCDFATVSVKNGAGREYKRTIPASKEWTQVVIDGIDLSAGFGEFAIGDSDFTKGFLFSMEGKEGDGSVLYLDDVVLEKVSDKVVVETVYNPSFEDAAEPGFIGKFVGHGQVNELFTDWYGFGWWGEDGNENSSIRISHTADAHNGKYAVKIDTPGGVWPSLNLFQQNGTLANMTGGTWRFSFWTKGTCDFATAAVKNGAGREYRVTIPASEDWTQVVIDDMNLSSGFGEFAIGDSDFAKGFLFSIEGSDAAATLYLDDIVLEKVSDQSPAEDSSSGSGQAADSSNSGGESEDSTGAVVRNGSFERAAEPGFAGKFVGHGQVNELFPNWYGFGWWGEDGNENSSIRISHTTDAYEGKYAVKINLPKGGWPSLNLFQKGQSLDTAKGGTWRFSFWTKGTCDLATISVKNGAGQEYKKAIPASEDWRQVVIDKIDLSSGLGDFAVGESDFAKGFMFSIEGEGDGSTLYLDHIVLEKISDEVVAEMVLNPDFEDATEPGFTDKIVGHGQVNELFDGWYGFGWWGEDGNEKSAIRISQITDAHGGRYAARIDMPATVGWPLLNLFQQGDDLVGITDGIWRFSFWTKGDCDFATVAVKNGAGKEYKQTIPASEDWVQVVIEDIDLSSGLGEFALGENVLAKGFVFTLNAPEGDGSSLYLDDIVFEKVGEKEPEEEVKEPELGGVLTNGGFAEGIVPGFAGYVGPGQINEIFSGWYGFGWWGEDHNENSAIRISQTTDAHGGKYAAKIDMPAGGWPSLNLFPQEDDLVGITDGIWQLSFWTKGNCDFATVAIKNGAGQEYKQTIPASEDWTQVVIGDIDLSSGLGELTLEDNIFAKGFAFTWNGHEGDGSSLYLDDIVFEKVGEKEPEEEVKEPELGGVLVNGGFAEGIVPGFAGYVGRGQTNEVFPGWKGFGWWGGDTPENAIRISQTTDAHGGKYAARIDMPAGGWPSLNLFPQEDDLVGITDGIWRFSFWTKGDCDFATVAVKNGAGEEYEQTIPASEDWTQVVIGDIDLSSGLGELTLEDNIFAKGFVFTWNGHEGDSSSLYLDDIVFEKVGEKEPEEEVEEPQLGGVLTNGGFAEGIVPGFVGYVGHCQVNEIFSGWYGYGWWGEDGNENSAIRISQTTDAHGGKYAARIDMPAAVGWPLLNLFQQGDDLVGITDGIWRFSFWAKGDCDFATVTVKNGAGTEYTQTIPASEDWTQVVIKDIDLSSGLGEYAIGESDFAKGFVFTWEGHEGDSSSLYLDDIVFEKVGEKEPEEEVEEPQLGGVLTNGGFAEGLVPEFAGYVGRGQTNEVFPGWKGFGWWGGDTPENAIRISQTTDAHGGKYAARIDMPAGGWPSLNLFPQEDDLVGITGGIWRFSFWTKGNCNFATVAVKNGAGQEYTQPIPASVDWTQVVIENIDLSSGLGDLTLEDNVFAKGFAFTWNGHEGDSSSLYLDDVVFEKVTEPEALLKSRLDKEIICVFREKMAESGAEGKTEVSGGDAEEPDIGDGNTEEPDMGARDVEEADMSDKDAEESGMSAGDAEEADMSDKDADEPDVSGSSL